MAYCYTQYVRRKGLVVLVIVIAVVVLGIFGFLAIASDFGRAETGHGNPLTQMTSKRGCDKNTNPVFSNAPTEIENIKLISPPIMKVSSGIKSHSYIETFKPSPVYAPVDSVLVNGAKYHESYVDPSKLQYSLFFSATCNVSYYYDHLIDVSDKIAEQFTDEPLMDDTRSTQTEAVEVKAGELIGYSWSRQFDFGVLDNTTEPALKDFEEYKHSEKAYAVCPLKFFEEGLKAKLFEKVGYFDSTNLTVIDNLCD